MKKLVRFYYRCSFNVCLWAFLSLIGFIFLSSSAFAEQDGDYTYTVSDGNATITGYTGAGGAISIPATLGGYPTVAIGDSAFYYNTSLTSVTIPDSVTSIGAEAFVLCTGLTSVTIPDSVTSIGNYAFYACTSLTSVTIPDSVTSIGNGAFAGCSGLTSIVVDANNPAYSSQDGVLYNKAKTVLIQYPSGKSGGFIIPDSVTSIGDYAFGYCYGLTNVTIGNSVTSIGAEAFASCSSLTSMTIPDSVTSIGNYAFQNCTGLTSVTIGNSVTSIGEYAFAYCYGLTSVTIPDSVTSIGDYAFNNCTGLTSVTIGNNVTSIGNSAFSSCSGLTNVTIGNSVTTIGIVAFAGCSGLTSVTIPDSVTTIGGAAFAYCSSLTSIFVDASNTVYCSQDGVLYDKAKTVLIQYPGVKSGGFTIPDSVTSIGDYAFAYCSGLTSVTIPDSVTSIGDGVFYYCTGLTSVTIGNSVTSIGNSAFYYCYGLTSVTIGNSVTSIGEDAFAHCIRLTSVTIPNSVTSIGDYAFNNCTGLTSITIGNSVTSIGNCAFYYCYGLTSMTLPNSVTSIGYEAFAGCSGLTSVTIPDSVTSIGWYAFSNCSDLTKAYFLGNAPAMGEYVFAGCASNFFICYTAGATGFTTPTWCPVNNPCYPAAVCSPQINIVNPQANTVLQDGIVFKGTASDFSGIYTVSFYVREPDGGEGISIGYDDLEASYNSTSGYWEYHFDTTKLQDGNYVVFAKATDNEGNEGMSSVVPFSIRNWAVITMLPDTRSNKAGRTMPIKFSLRIAKSVDPAMPFVYNEDLQIRIYRCDNTSCSSKTLMQTSVYGTKSTDYRIDVAAQLYQTNFQTQKTPAQYLVEIWRPSNNFLVGSFSFKTVK